MSHLQQNFRQIVALLSDRFGNLNLGINQGARSLDEMLPLDGVHRQVVHSMLQDIYRHNACTSLDSTITAEHTFDALGELAWKLKSAQHAELDALSLLEQIGECLAELLTPSENEPNRNNLLSAGSQPVASNSRAEIPKSKPATPSRFRLPS